MKKGAGMRKYANVRLGSSQRMTQEDVVVNARRMKA
jgi:hypothetical protein